MRNCIILNNSMGPVLLAGDDEIINCAGSGFVHCCSSPLLNGLGNVAGDPGFVHVAQTNFNLTMGSPCLDAGMNLSWMDSAFDFAGAARINHGIVDIGAYEYDFDSGSLRGALRADRTKGVTPLQVELRALIAGVGTEPLLYRWDFDGDGIVDREGYDLMAVSYEYPQPGHYSASLTLSQGLGAPVVISNLSLYSAPAFIHVSPSGQNTFPFTNWIMAATNIQTAVDVGVSGSRVLVTGGLYRIASSIRVTNGIWLCGMNGAASTLVEGVYSNRCFYLNHTGAVLEGFTIRKGYEKYEDGGGVLCKSGMVKRCILVDNQADWGGGIYLMGGRAEDCLVYSNAARCGGGIYFRYDGVGQNCLVYGNRAAYGGGVYCFNGGRVQNCTISGNWATNGGGLATYHGGAAANTILTGNYGSNGLNYFIEGYPAAWSYCCAYPLLSGAGSLNADPQFVDATARDYHLQAGSPCVDAGHTEVFPSFDLDGLPRPLDGHADGAPRCDIGCYEFMHALADSDGDELVDANELAMGSSPTLWDSDADGSGDGDERIAGTDACDGQSVFALRAGESSPGEDSIIRWPSAPGRTYTLSRTTNLLNGFSVLAVDLPATPPENCYTDAVMQSGFQAYQVKVHE
ncbi:MAG TPA: hypothetical protein DCZ95_13645 [Verrucomicrobia bacterium]|nr:MAG: hypothetical protein A2X46_19215 [Lentisphaerae bacterium GWF2_57_35]HBA85128.1 hypothetical protein [Verrucomicrobiota bacterium]